MNISELFFSIAPFADKAVMAVLGLMSAAALAISIERYVFLSPIYRKSMRTARKLKSILQSGNLQEMESLAQDTKHPAGRVMSYAMAFLKKNQAQVRPSASGLSDLLRAACLQEKQTLEGSVSLLATVGSNAPFVGLLGTVFGIMRSFHDLGAAIQEANQQTVMAGISIALLATALGLAAAIPSVMLYNYFRRKIARILDTLENAEKICLAYSQLHFSAAKKPAKAAEGSSPQNTTRG